jgi:hypothetical protein
MFYVTESAAEGEPAWKGAGQEVGLQIWRIVVRTETVTTYVVINYLTFSRETCPRASVKYWWRLLQLISVETFINIRSDR